MIGEKTICFRIPCLSQGFLSIKHPHYRAFSYVLQVLPSSNLAKQEPHKIHRDSTNSTAILLKQNSPVLCNMPWIWHKKKGLQLTYLSSPRRIWLHPPQRNLPSISAMDDNQPAYQRIVLVVKSSLVPPPNGG